MPEWISVVWAAAVALTHIAGAIAVTVHAILQPRQARGVVAWIGLAWLAPVIGSFAYLCLGINRIRRLGRDLGINNARQQVDVLKPRASDILKMQNLARLHPGLVGLGHLGGQVTQRQLLVGNEIDTLVNGDEAYPAMLEGIDQARHSVALLSYIFDSDRVGDQFLAALVRAVDRGVAVRVLIDCVGARYSKPNMVKKLRAAGVPVAAFLPTSQVGLFRFANLRNHRKILVIDGVVGFTGGTNIREGHALNLNPDFPVQCLHFRIRGPVVTHLQEVFTTDWAFTTGEKLEGHPWFHPPDPQGNVSARGISDGPDEDLDKMQEILLGAIAAASHRIAIVTPYFLPDDVVRSALAIAAMRNVQVDIVIPAKNNIRIMDWATVPQMPFLIEKGCRIHHTPAPFDHTKLVVVDSAWSLIGSTNWDARSLRLNFEFNLECYDQHFAKSLEALIEQRIENSTTLTLDHIHRRRIHERLRDGILQLFSPYL